MRNYGNNWEIKEILNTIPIGGALFDIGCMSMMDILRAGGDVAIIDAVEFPSGVIESKMGNKVNIWLKKVNIFASISLLQ